MSLQIWLPLNGNLENQGLNSSLFTPSATYDNNGKIGKCLSSNIALSVQDNLISKITLNNQYSFALWMKSKNSSGWAFRFGDINGNTPSNSRGMWINIDGNYEFAYQGSGTNINLASTICDNNWHHIVYSVNDKSAIIYIDGKFVKNLTLAYNQQLNYEYIQLNGNISYINDFRIYDHCLSPKEVKEISKGLCLHYKLAGPGQENLIKDSQLPIFNYGGGGTWCTFTKSIVDDNGLCCRFDCTATGVCGKYYYPDGVDITAWAGQIFTWSFEAKANKNIIFKAGHERGGVTNITITPQWTTFSKTWTFTSSGKYAFIMYPSTNISVGDWFEVRNIKIEKGSIATSWCPNPTDTLYGTLGYNNNIEDDCSGYCHHGVKSGTIISDSDSPRYPTSYKFNTGIDYIKSAFSLSMSELSCSFWVKPNSSNGGYSIIASNYNNPPSGFWLAINTEGSGVWFYNGSYVAGRSLLTNNVWHHCVFTFKNGIGTWYVNGTSVVSTDISSRGTSLSINNLTVGNSYTGTSWNTKNYGNISDFRVYATALSAADILELYETSGAIDSHYNSYAYEYIADDSNEYLNSQGISGISDLEETDENTKWLSTGKIESNNFYEI